VSFTNCPVPATILSFLSSRANPDFLFAALERAACAVFCKENRMEFATSPTLTGNPGQPRDLQFYGPLLKSHYHQSSGQLRNMTQ
jgi:hypothetical protein